MQFLQTSIMKSAICVTKVQEELIQKMSTPAMKVDYKELSDSLDDALMCMGVSTSEVVARRREMVQPHLSQDFQRICNQITPYTDKLYGHDLDGLLQEIRSTNSLTQKLKKHTKAARGKGPYSRPNGNGAGFRQLT